MGYVKGKKKTATKRQGESARKKKHERKRHFVARGDGISQIKKGRQMKSYNKRQW